MSPEINITSQPIRYKLKLRETWPTAFSRALGGLHVFISSSHWPSAVFSFVCLAIVILQGLDNLLENNISHLPVLNFTIVIYVDEVNQTIKLPLQWKKTGTQI